MIINQDPLKLFCKIKDEQLMHIIDLKLLPLLCYSLTLDIQIYNELRSK